MNNKLLTVCTMLLITFSLAAVPLPNRVGGAGFLEAASPTAIEKRSASSLTCDPFNFAPALNFWVYPHSSVSAVGDFNGDGRKDIVRTGSGGDVGGSNPNRTYLWISVLVGDGTGGFSSAPQTEANGNITSMAVGEFDGDGRDDVAALWYDTESGGAGIWILSGGEGLGGNFIEGYYSDPLVVGDFNGDGNKDLAGLSGGGLLTVLLGDGTGAFALTPNPPIVPYSQLAVGDFNADGKEDLVAPGPGQNVSLILAVGDGTFGAPIYFSTDGVTPRSITVGDFNLDGNKDLVTNNLSTVSVLLGNGAGSFGTATTFAIATDDWPLTVGDFNGDGNSDIATRNSNYLAVVVGNGNGGFGDVVNVGGPVGFASIGRADFNGDGRHDIAAVNSNYGVSVYLAQCGIATPTPTPTPVPTPTPTPMPTPTPTATPTPLVTVSGVVLEANGSGINHASVTMTDASNVVTETLTNQTGAFSFANVLSGTSYTFRATKKRAQFSNGTQTIFVTGSINNLTFNALP